MKIVVRKRFEKPPYMKFLLTLTALGLSLTISMIILYITSGIPPEKFFYSIYTGLFDQSTLRYMVPLTLCGLGLILPYKAGIWNIGSEGQLLAGAIITTYLALYIFPRNIPFYLGTPILLASSFIAGGLYAFIAGYLKAKFNLNEILSTLMLNYIIIGIGNYFVYGPWRGETQYGYPRTDIIPEQLWINAVSVGGIRINITFILMILVIAVIFAKMFKHTRFGYEITVYGLNTDAAIHSGISKEKIIILTMFISGGLAGLAGAGEILSIHRQLINVQNVSAGYGYMAILVAWLSRMDPLATILSGYLVAALIASGYTLQIIAGLTIGAVNLFVGGLLIITTALDFLLEYEVEIRW